MIVQVGGYDRAGRHACKFLIPPFPQSRLYSVYGFGSSR